MSGRVIDRTCFRKKLNGDFYCYLLAVDINAHVNSALNSLTIKKQFTLSEKKFRLLKDM